MSNKSEKTFIKRIKKSVNPVYSKNEDGIDIDVFSINKDEESSKKASEDDIKISYEFNLGGYKCSIVNFDFAYEYKKNMEKTKWCYYVSIDKKELGQVSLNSILNDFHETELYNCVSWHGEMTYCNEKDGDIVAGCDYQHAFDEGKKYSLDSVLEDICETIVDIDYYYPQIESTRLAKKEKKVIFDEISNHCESNASSFKI